ncbi:hypothetical protein SAMN04487819_108173 [Actinopolyspora alba]|uniref:Uncharacterized protein n=1 Tax=Actinopolyspora alba TaxID=673379 RepID=A0A1I1Y4N7_9ACTN|nr:hypothetical protein [Actinopolyspora alba]SFE14635.1 hypothetical protein SAMN04487819_108173 [Actinopolyspora alba]
MTTTARGELANTVAVLDPYVIHGGQGAVLDAPEKVLTDIPEEQLHELRTALAKFNTAEHQPSPEEARTVARGVWRGEHGYIKHHWYGWELGMDSYLCNKVTGGLITAGGVATAVGAGTSGPAAGIIAGAFSILIGMVIACEHDNGWSYIYLIGAPPFTPGGVVCNPFG